MPGSERLCAGLDGTVATDPGQRCFSEAMEDGSSQSTGFTGRNDVVFSCTMFMYLRDGNASLAAIDLKLKWKDMKHVVGKLLRCF